MRFVLLCTLCAAACSAPLDLGFGVAVTATFDSSVSDAQLATVTHFAIAATGDQAYNTDEPINRAAHRTEGFVYRPEDSTRRLALMLTAEDANDVPIAVGQSSQIQLDAGKTAQLEITLFAAMPSDAGVPDAALDAATDASGPDLAVNDGAIDEDGGQAFHVCAGLSYELCEDFEHGTGAEWAVSSMNSSIVVGTTFVHSGGHAMHVHLDSVAASGVAIGVLKETTTLGTANADFHARAFFYFPAAPPSGALQMIEAQQTVTPFSSMNFEIVDAHPALFDHFATSTTFIQSPTTLPKNEWFCVEWNVHFGAPGALTMDINGAPLSTQINDTTTSTPPVTQLFFGGSLTNATSSASAVVDFWMDDLVVDPNPIGCSD
jgi:hypothetical protein